MIYYCQEENYICFYIDRFLSQEISDWNKSILLTSRQLASLKAADNPFPDYVIRLTPQKEKISVEVERDTVGRITIDRFQKELYIRQYDKNLLIDTVFTDKITHNLNDLRDILTKSKRLGLILSVDFEFYKDIPDWIASEAFSGRYQYEFFYFYARPNDLDGAVIDTQTGKKVLLDPWADTYNGPLAD